ncbi:MAG: alpha/beta hydrolase [Myxococcota bacterium]
MKRFGEKLTRGALKRIVRMPEPLNERLFGAPPTNDRGVPLDHQVHALLRVMDKTYSPSLDELGPEKAREAYALSSRLFDAEPRPLRSIVDDRVKGPAGPVPLRIYRPNHGGDAPAIVYFHGGGFVVGDLEAYHGMCSRLADETDCIVISVDYRLAPEHPFPAAVDDCLAAFEWVHENATRLGLNPDRLSVAGDSAGGTLAAVVTQQLLERGGPMPSHQLLMYPSTDTRDGYESMETLAEGFYLESSLVHWFSRTYLQDHSDHADPRVSPVTFERLGELPPAYVVTAGFDPLRDKGERYVDELESAGTRVLHQSFDRLIHGFVTMSGMLDAADLALTEIADEFRAFAG